MDVGRQLNRCDMIMSRRKRGSVKPREESEDAEMQRDRQNQPNGNPIRPVPFERFTRVLLYWLFLRIHFTLTFIIYVQAVTFERSVLKAGERPHRPATTYLVSN